MSRGTLDPASLDFLFAYGAITLIASFSKTVLLKKFLTSRGPKPRNARIPVWALSLSLAATQEIDFSFSSSGYLDVSVHRVPVHTLWIGVWTLEVHSSRFPHSDISGSMDICSSPKLFAAYHVFHRLLVPRHPPYALSCLTFYFRARSSCPPVFGFVLVLLVFLSHR